MAVIAWCLPDDHTRRARTRSADEATRPHARPLHRVARAAPVRVARADLVRVRRAHELLGVLRRRAAASRRGACSSSAMAVSILIGPPDDGPDRSTGAGTGTCCCPCLAAPPVGLFLLALAQGTDSFLVAALVFGAGFGLMYPAFTSYVMAHVSTSRRGAAFGAMLAAFDTGIGTGSSTMGWLIHHIRASGWHSASAAAVAALSLPLFLFAERRVGLQVICDAHCHFFSATFFRTLGRDLRRRRRQVRRPRRCPRGSAGIRPATDDGARRSLGRRARSRTASRARC